MSASKKNIGLFFGTFNPIHVGHLILANFMAQLDQIDEVWFVVTPQNPFKQKQTLLPDVHRYALVQRAIEGNLKLKVSKVEFDLPQPNYTVNTLAVLTEKHPHYTFTLIMGEDNLRGFRKWKNHEVILQNHPILVYPRAYTKNESTQLQVDDSLLNHGSIHLVNAPLMKFSSSDIRQLIAQGKSAQYLLTDTVYQYVDEMNFYRS